MRRFFLLLLPFIFILLSGCSTSYGPTGITGGYSDTQLNKSTYLVNFQGNGYTSKDRVNKYLLVRAAEITKQNGYKYFTILSYNPDTSVGYVATPTRVESNSSTSYSGVGTGYRGNYNLSGVANTSSTATITPGQTYRIEKHSNSIMMQILEKPDSSALALDADIILASHSKKK